MQIRLEERYLSKYPSLHSSERMELMRGVDDFIRAAFDEMKIRAPFDLLVRGQKPAERSKIARTILRQEWKNLSPEEEKRLLPGYREQVDFLVRQADLLRCFSNSDTVFLLAEAGTRGCEDFLAADLNQLHFCLSRLKGRHADVKLPSMDELYEKRQKQIPSAYVTKNGKIWERPPQLPTQERIRLEQSLNEWESTLAPADKRLLAERIRAEFNGYGGNEQNAEGLEIVFLHMEYDNPAPAFLRKSAMQQKPSDRVGRSDTEILCEGLKFLQNITVALPLPRTISGRISMKKDPFSRKTQPLPGCRVQISGIADSGRDPNPTDEELFCYTDHDGYFSILMPERYNMKERLTLTVSENMLGQTVGAVDYHTAANAEHQMTFIRRASEIMDAEYIWAGRVDSDEKEYRQEVLMRYEKASKDPQKYTLKQAKDVLLDLDRLEALNSENMHLRARLRDKVQHQQRAIMQKIRVRDALQDYQNRINDLISELQSHQAEAEKPLKELQEKCSQSGMDAVEQRRFWTLCYHQNLYLKNAHEAIMREEMPLRGPAEHQLVSSICAVYNQKLKKKYGSRTPPRPHQYQYVAAEPGSMEPEELDVRITELTQIREMWNSAYNARLCSEEEFDQISLWHDAYFGDANGGSKDREAALRMEPGLPKLTEENRALYEAAMNCCEQTYLVRTDYFDGVYGGRQPSEPIDLEEGPFALYARIDPLDYDSVSPDDFMELRDERTAVIVDHKDIAMETRRMEEQVDIFKYLIRKAREERDGIILPEIPAQEKEDALGTPDEWFADLPSMEQYGIRFSHYLEQGEEKLRQIRDSSIFDDCENFRTFVRNYHREQENLEQLWSSMKNSREYELETAAEAGLDRYLDKAILEGTDSDAKQLAQNEAVCRDIMQGLFSLDHTTNNVELTIRNFLAMPMDAYLGEITVIESAFRGKTAGARVLPSVRLMGEGADAVYLPTDTAPSRIFNFSMMQRLVEPTLNNAIADDSKEDDRDSVVKRKKLDRPINVMDFRKKLREKQEQLPVASSLGMGYTLNMHQAWVPDGFALGDLLYSLVLAPGEEQRLIVQEHKETYNVSDDAFAEDGITDIYRNAQDDNESAVFDQGAKRYSGAHSDYKYNADASSMGNSVCLGLSSFSQADSSSSGRGSSNAFQRDSYDEASTAAQNFQTAIKTEASRLATAKRASIRIASSEDSESIASKIVANHNHSHVMTVQYWEVMRRYRMETCIDSIDLILFVPLQPMHFLPDYDESQTKKIQEYNNYHLPVQLSEDEKTNAYLSFTREIFNHRYSNILPYAERLEQAVPYRYRGGLRLMQKFASLPEWSISTRSEQSTEYKVSIEGRVLEIDRLWATLEISGSQQVIHGEFSTYAPLKHDLSMNTRKDLLYALRGLREGVQFSKTGVENSKSDAKNEYYHQYSSSDISDSSRKIEITFHLPAGISCNDVARLNIGRDLRDYQIRLCQDTQYLSTSEKFAMENYYHKEVNLYEDKDNSDYDRDKMAHFWKNMPECYREPIVTLSREDQIGTGSLDLMVSLAGEDVARKLRLSGEKVSVYLENRIPQMTFSDFMEMEGALHHVCDDTLRYSQVIWSSLSDDERILMLEPYTVEMDFKAILDGEDVKEEETVNVPLLSCVNAKKLIGFYGNCMMLPFIYPRELARQLGKNASEVQDELYRFHTTNYRVPTTMISVPTEGMVGEAVLGATNVSEKIDITRFWNWKDSEIDKMDINQSSIGRNSLLEGAEPLRLDAPTQGAAATGHISPSGLLNALTSRAQPVFADALKNTDLRELMKAVDENVSSGRDKVVEANGQNIRSAFEAISSIASAYLGAPKKKKEGETPASGEGSADSGSGSEDSDASAGSASGGGGGTTGGNGETSSGGASGAGTSGGETSSGGGQKPGGGSSSGGAFGAGASGGGTSSGGEPDVPVTPGVEQPDSTEIQDETVPSEHHELDDKHENQEKTDDEKKTSSHLIPEEITDEFIPGCSYRALASAVADALYHNRHLDDSAWNNKSLPVDKELVNDIRHKLEYRGIAESGLGILGCGVAELSEKLRECIEQLEAENPKTAENEAQSEAEPNAGEGGK